MNDINGLSKYFSYLLRHHPEELDLSMDNAGWVSVDELIEKVNRNRNFNIDINTIKEVVARNNKQRFALKQCGDDLYIRANQGHSIKNLNVGYEPIMPPDILYHGTAKKSENSIRSKGLLKMSRQYVHLSSDFSVAISVGQRHGKVVVFEVDSKRMFQDGIKFYRSENGVWLTDYVSPKYLKKIF